MPLVTRTEQTRSPANIVTNVRCYVYDEFGREYYADVPHAQCVGVTVGTVTSAVLRTLQDAVAAKSIGPGLAYTPAQITVQARAAGSRV